MPFVYLSETQPSFVCLSYICVMMIFVICGKNIYTECSIFVQNKVYFDFKKCPECLNSVLCFPCIKLTLYIVFIVHCGSSLCGIIDEDICSVSSSVVDL